MSTLYVKYCKTNTRAQLEAATVADGKATVNGKTYDEGTIFYASDGGAIYLFNGTAMKLHGEENEDNLVTTLPYATLNPLSLRQLTSEEQSGGDLIIDGTHYKAGTLFVPSDRSGLYIWKGGRFATVAEAQDDTGHLVFKGTKANLAALPAYQGTATADAPGYKTGDVYLAEDTGVLYVAYVTITPATGGQMDRNHIYDIAWKALTLTSEQTEGGARWLD